MKTETEQKQTKGASSRAAHGSAAYLSDDVSVGMVARWINDAHMKAWLEKPPNMDYMRAMQRLGEAVQGALDSYRRATQPPNVGFSDDGRKDSQQ